RSDERGATLVITTLCLLALLGFSSLAIDVSVLYVRKQREVNVCDAADLAAAKAYIQAPLGSSDDTRRSAAQSAANVVASQNGASNPPLTYTPSTGKPTQVQAHTSETVPLIFARVMGPTQSVVGATANCELDYIPNEVTKGLRPFGVDSNVMNTVTYG